MNHILAWTDKIHSHWRIQWPKLRPGNTFVRYQPVGKHKRWTLHRIRMAGTRSSSQYFYRVKGRRWESKMKRIATKRINYQAISLWIPSSMFCASLTITITCVTQLGSAHRGRKMIERDLWDCHIAFKLLLVHAVQIDQTTFQEL